MNGDLPATLSSMSGQDLWDFVKNMKRGGGMTAGRPCQNFFSCKLLGKKTNVEIVASQDARFQDALNAGVNGTIVAIAENKGNYATVRYDFKPNDANTRHVYAFVVYNKTATTGPTYVLTEITKADGVYSHTERPADTFTLCNHAKEWDASTAAFQTCNGTMSRGTVSHSLVLMGMGDFGLPRLYLKSVALLASLLYAEDDPPGWITCGAGCCTMGALI